MKNILLVLMGLCLWGVSVGSAQAPSFGDDSYLLVIDIQEHFTHEKLHPDTAAVLIDNINCVVESVAPDNVLYVMSILSVLNLSLKGFQVDTLDGLDLDERLLVVSPHIFEKNKANAFGQDEIAEFFHQHKATEIVIVGLLAEHCVLKSALGAQKEGIQVIIMSQCVAGKTSEKKAKSLRKLKRKGITLVSYFPD